MRPLALLAVACIGCSNVVTGTTDPNTELAADSDTFIGDSDLPREGDTAPAPADDDPAPDADPPLVDIERYADAIDGFRIEAPCAVAVGEDQCDVATEDDRQTHELAFGGAAADLYTVEVRVRGVVEPMMYKGGELEGSRLYIGGEPDNGTYNIYQLSIEEPEQHYYFNYAPSVGHQVFVIDYIFHFDVRGGGTLTFDLNGQNGREISNYPDLTMPEIATTPFDGQFIQLDVVSVEVSENQARALVRP